MSAPSQFNSDKFGQVSLTIGLVIDPRHYRLKEANHPLMFLDRNVEWVLLYWVETDLNFMAPVTLTWFLQTSRCHPLIDYSNSKVWRLQRIRQLLNKTIIEQKQFKINNPFLLSWPSDLQK
jgi:hypothetical protein